MLLVKCDQCGASYKLSEDLYRNKAEGYGVVVTCRRCKAEIHVQNPTTEESAAATKVESGNDLPTSPVNERPDTVVEPKPQAKPEPKPSPPVPKVAPKAPSPAAPPVAAKPPAPPAAPKAPTPGGLPPRPAPRPPSPATSKAPPLPKGSGKLVALSPGLLGTVTAVKESPKPPAAATKESTAQATPETPASERDTIPPLGETNPDAPPDSEMPVDSGDFLPAESAPNSEMSVDSSDFIKSSAAAVPEPAKEDPKKKLPTAPAMKKPVPPTKADAKADEQPSTTGTPKLETLVHGPAIGADQKQGDGPRKRLASGDLSDDFMSADLGFDVPAALAPPTADALLKAPISSRPGPPKEGAAAKTTESKPASRRPSTKPSSKTARPVVVKQESSAGVSRGKMAVLALVVLGGGALFFRGRLGPSVPEPEPPSAAEAPAAAEKPEPPAPEPAPVATELAPPPTASAEAPPSTPSPPPTGAPAPGTPATTTKPSTASPAVPQPASTAVAAAPKPAESAAPAPAEPREPRGSAGTEPFDAAAARTALDASAAQASSCRKPGDPSGVAVVMITFAPTGRVTSANIGGPPFAATPTGGCIASTLRKTRIPAFAGDMVTVKKTVTIH